MKKRKQKYRKHIHGTSVGDHHFEIVEVGVVQQAEKVLQLFVQRSLGRRLVVVVAQSARHHKQHAAKKEQRQKRSNQFHVLSIYISSSASSFSWQGEVILTFFSFFNHIFVF